MAGSGCQAMVVVRGKALLVRLDQPGVGATTFERLGNNQNQSIFQDIIVICICQRLLADFETKEKPCQNNITMYYYKWCQLSAGHLVKLHIFGQKSYICKLDIQNIGFVHLVLFEKILLGESSSINHVHAVDA